MSRRVFAICILILVLSAIVIAGNGWEETPYTQWSREDVIAVLYNSPWSVLCPAVARRLETRTRTGENTGVWVSAMYQVRLLTARPIREAILRLFSLSGVVLDAKDLAKGIVAEREQEILQKLLTSDQNNFMIKGDGNCIFILLTVLESVPQSSQWREDPADKELWNPNISELLAKTSLATNTGKHVALADYEGPGPDQLGAKFLFPRRLPDGTPFIAAGDTELRFETRINKTKIRVKFDLRKMLYKGKLET